MDRNGKTGSANAGIAIAIGIGNDGVHGGCVIAAEIAPTMVIEIMGNIGARKWEIADFEW
jgi:hypothetical protein